jgi:hypothetical protein
MDAENGTENSDVPTSLVFEDDRDELPIPGYGNDNNDSGDNSFADWTSWGSVLPDFTTYPTLSVSDGPPELDDESYLFLRDRIALHRRKLEQARGPVTVDWDHVSHIVRQITALDLVALMGYAIELGSPGLSYPVPASVNIEHLAQQFNANKSLAMIAAAACTCKHNLIIAVGGDLSFEFRDLLAFKYPEELRPVPLRSIIDRLVEAVRVSFSSAPLVRLVVVYTIGAFPRACHQEDDQDPKSGATYLS